MVGGDYMQLLSNEELLNISGGRTTYYAAAGLRLIIVINKWLAKMFK